MPVQFTESTLTASKPVYLAASKNLSGLGLTESQIRWATAQNFAAKPGEGLLLPSADGSIAGALLGYRPDSGPWAPMETGKLAAILPSGDWHLPEPPENADLALLGLGLGAYNFTTYRSEVEDRQIRIQVPQGVRIDELERRISAVSFVRDLVNTPANDMGPESLEAAIRGLAETHRAEVATITGDELLSQNLPMIHAVGRASTSAPRLIDMRWGRKDAPAVTLVGKGVCFDTGGLDIKPASGMLLMKKDMGGAANVLGLASLIMGSGAAVRLRVLVPAVENAISGNAFRPGDVLRSRKGISVEIGNTDAEGRLVLADALALADEEEPQLLIDMATLTGAARVALGPDLPPFYTSDDTFADDLTTAGRELSDPVWRMPLWEPYHARMASKVATVNNVTSDAFAGSITAALFLSRFVEKASTWAHFDIFAWNPVAKAHCPIGGEAQAIRALERVISKRFG